LVAFVPGVDRPAERTALGTAGHHRGRMMEELVPLLHHPWTGQPSDGSGVRLPVLPVQHPLEIWLGGSGPDAVARAPPPSRPAALRSPLVASGDHNATLAHASS
jgi:alkanesulfonate monooxygenase SsuD/methylene tetrahydromethanopterin reductase-like flavin-dependent oxidoreductase (luciferase family)